MRYYLFLILIYIVISVVVCFGLPVFALDKAFSGNISLKQTVSKNKPKSVNLKFFVNDNLVRINTPKNLYYLINLDNETVYTVNTKRKTITKGKGSDLVNFSLPPLVVFKSSDDLKVYLKESKAINKKTFRCNKSLCQLWELSLNDSGILITVKLPDFLPQKAKITSDASITEIFISSYQPIKKQNLNATLFDQPKGFKLLDLIGK